MNLTTQFDDQIMKIAQQLKILSVETRLRMLLSLRDRNLCVGALACRLGLTQGAVSQHLKILRDAGLVTAKREGYYVHYRVDEDELGQWQRGIDGLLVRLQAGGGDEEAAGETNSARCRKHKEELCVRRESRVAAKRDGR